MTALEPIATAAQARRIQQAEKAVEYERVAASDPGRLKRRIYGLIAASYGFLLLLCVIGIGGFGIIALVGLFRWQLLLQNLFLFGPLAVVSYVALRSVWVRIPLPDGVPLKRDDAPELWRMVEEAAAELRATPPAKILLTIDFNIVAKQQPRFGIVGGFRTYLQVGARSLFTLSESELRGKLAQEFGRFSGENGRLSAWIHRVAEMWLHLVDSARERIAGGWLIRIFAAKWGVAFVPAAAGTRRKQWLHANERAAAMVGARTVAASLCRHKVASESLTESREGVRLARETLVDDESRKFKANLSSLSRPIDPVTARQSLERALQWPTKPLDHTPSLADQLRALGVDPHVNFESLLADAIKPRRPAAGSTMLRLNTNDFLEAYFANLARQYPQLKVPLTELERERATDARSEMARLERKIGTRTFGLDEKVKLTTLLFGAGKHAEAEKLARAIIAESPERLHTRFLLGRHLIRENKVEGVEHLEVVASAQLIRAEEALKSLQNFWRTVGDRDRNEDVSLRLSAQRALNKSEFRDAESLECRGRITAAVLSDEERDSIISAARYVGSVGTVHAVMLKSESQKRERLVLYVFDNDKLDSFDKERAVLARQLSAAITADRVWLVVAPDDRKKWRKVLAAFPDALVFDRKELATK